MGPTFLKFLSELLAKWDFPGYLVPAFKAGTTRRKWLTRRWQHKSMLNHQWVCLLRQVAIAIGWHAEDLGALSYKSMRRFLPTLTNVLGFPPDVAQAIGSWQDMPQGEGTKGQAIQSMSLHYSDERASASGQTKRAVLTHFFSLLKGHARAASTFAGTGSFLATDELP